MIEKSTGKKLQTLHTDNGGEYTLHKFQAYLKNEGVKHELTIPRMPQRNEVAERLNCTLMESVRSMVNYLKGFGQRSWLQLCTSETEAQVR